MAEITLTINDKEVKGEDGDTILNVCQKNDIDVPTLCHFDGIPDMGSCRICIVEIEGSGRPRISTSCTTPATDGMIIKTDTEKLRGMRRNVLEFLLSEGNHHCMYCAASGDCELQDLAYRFGIDYIKMPVTPSEESTHVDSSQRYLVADPNRCILCYRCVRVCNDMAGNRVLGISNRGSKAQIISDMGENRGESGCVSCGTCVQVCPTGAILDRRSAYMGRKTEVDTTKSTCLFCSVGCGTEIISRDNYLIRIEGDWDAEPNKGLLCVLGRFSPLYDECRARANKPMIRKDDQLQEATWNEALNAVAEKLKFTDKDKIGGLVSTHATTETLKLFAKYSDDLGAKNVGCIEGPISDPPEKGFDLSDLNDADLYVVVGEDLSEGLHQVVGFLIKRNLIERDKRLVIVNDEETDLIEFADEHLKISELDKAIELCKDAENPIVVYNDEAINQVDKMREELAENAKFFWMPPGINSRGALAAGLDGEFDPDKASCIYVMACEAGDISEELLSKLKKADFVAVQTSYMEPWDEVADVLLPTTIWAEREGTVINMEGQELKVNKAVDPPKEVKAEADILNALAEKIG